MALIVSLPAASRSQQRLLCDIHARHCSCNPSHTLDRNPPALPPSQALINEQQGPFDLIYHRKRAPCQTRMEHCASRSSVIRTRVQHICYHSAYIWQILAPVVGQHEITTRTAPYSRMGPAVDGFFLSPHENAQLTGFNQQYNCIVQRSKVACSSVPAHLPSTERTAFSVHMCFAFHLLVRAALAVIIPQFLLLYCVKKLRDRPNSSVAMRRSEATGSLRVKDAG